MCIRLGSLIPVMGAAGGFSFLLEDWGEVGFWSLIGSGPEKYRERGSTAPRKGPFSQEGRTLLELK